MPDRKVDAQEQLLPRYPFISVVGPVGIGKSTFTELLIGDTGITQFTEPFKENKYLKLFYMEDHAKYAFPCQVFFLTEDGIKLMNAPKLLKNGILLQDGGEDTNSIIERVQWKMNMITDDDHSAYTSIKKYVYRGALKPDIYIALKAKESTVIRRIIERARPMELFMHKDCPDYYPMLVREYNTWLEEKLEDKSSKVVVIDTDEVNFANDSEQKEKIVYEAKNWLGYYTSAPTQRNRVGSDGARLIIPDLFRPSPNLTDQVPGKTWIS